MFITFEGMDGAGKTTQIRLLQERLEKAGERVVVTREPGGNALAEKIRALLLDPESEMDPLTEAYLYAAARAEHVRRVILPALQRGETVLCDRYLDSSLAYQGYGRGMDVDRLQQLNDFATDGLWPDLTLLLDLPVEMGLLRATRRNATTGLSRAEGRFEAETLAFHERIRQGFLARARCYPDRFRVLDATLPPPALAEQAWIALRDGAR